MNELTLGRISEWREVFAKDLRSVIPELSKAAEEKVAICDLALALLRKVQKENCVEAPQTRYEIARSLLQTFGQLKQMETARKIVNFVLDREGKWIA